VSTLLATRIRGPVMTVMQTFVARVLFGMFCVQVHLLAQDAGLAAVEWRQPKRCGVNALYVMLKAHGHDIDYARLSEATVVGERGASLAALCRAAESVGVRTLIQRGRPGDICGANFPILVHWDAYSGDKEEAGHYLVLRSYDRNANS